MSSELSIIVLRIAAASTMTALIVTCSDFTQLRISSSWGRRSLRCCTFHLGVDIQGPLSMGCPIQTNLAPDGEVNLLCVGGFVLYLRRGELYYFVFNIAPANSRITIRSRYAGALLEI